MPAGDRFFVDTNVLLYSLDRAAPAKRDAAKRWLAMLWENGSGCISWQVLHEFYLNATRKPGASNQRARSIVEVFALWQPIDSSLGLIQRAWYWTDKAQVSYWDALIVSAAERGGCAWLLSEDLQDGRRLGGVTIVNPFKRGPEAFGRDFAGQT
jgi:predicted nucleic acid-binding protein